MKSITNLTITITRINYVLETNNKSKFSVNIIDNQGQALTGNNWDFETAKKIIDEKIKKEMGEE